MMIHLVNRTDYRKTPEATLLEYPIIVCVYDNKATILYKSIDSQQGYFRGLSYNGSIHTLNDTVLLTLKKYVDDTKHEIHGFKTLGEFAHAVIDNGWSI